MCNENNENKDESEEGKGTNVKKLGSHSFTNKKTKIFELDEDVSED